MKNWLWWLLAGLVALVGGVLGLINPNAAQITSTTIAGWALVMMGLFQGCAGWNSTAFRERAGAGLLAATGLFIGLSLLIGPFGDGTLLRWILGGLLVVSGLAKLWVGLRYHNDKLFWAVIGAGGLSIVLGLYVLAGGGLKLGFILSLELLGSGTALVVMAVRKEKSVTH
ncbi:hypothetical protein HAT86_15145 [Roseovarius gahaiensis]|uniref:Acid-resistance membrane protein n=2 Tax=Roseovarius gahaiensis TaxID=2716691 RepID=A0A967BD23_9RHOB|nr:hypothetical protein [Roseovarius gahaiensis]